MDRRSAAKLLGIDAASTRAEARTAYLSMLASAASERLARPDWYAQRAKDLEDAYAAFGDAPTYGQATEGTAGTKPKGKVMTPGGIIALSFVGLVLLAAVIYAMVGGGNSKTTPTNPPPASVAPVESAQPELPTQPTQDSGQTGLVGTCFRDGPGAKPDAQGMVDLEQVSCSDTTAQWYAYKEATTSSQCSVDYLQTTNGEIVCLRQQ